MGGPCLQWRGSRRQENIVMESYVIGYGKVARGGGGGGGGGGGPLAFVKYEYAHAYVRQ